MAQDNATAEPLAATSILGERWSGDLDDLLPHRKLRVLVTYSRTNFFLDGAAPSGMTAMLFQDFERWLNQRLRTGKYPVSVVFIPVRHDELLPALMDGRGDIAAAGLTVTEARDALVDFSDPLYTDVREVVVRGAHAPRLKSVEDLSGRRVYVRRSSSYFESLDALSRRLAEMGRKPVLIEEADENLESEDFLELVGAAVVDYTVVERYRVHLWAQVIPNLVVREDLALATDRHIAWAVRENSPRLCAVLDEFLAGYKKRGSLAQLRTRFFGKPDYLRNPLASQELRRFNKAGQHFRKYAGQYGLDYLLMAAQGFQESRLDQRARSPQGAVGVMQLLPSTAAGAPVFMPRVHELETNIHAFFGGISLTAITDNAALTYLGSLVEGLSDGFKYALVAGAMTGGGLTIIANAPNPMGISILRGSFKDGAVSPPVAFRLGPAAHHGGRPGLLVPVKRQAATPARRTT